MKIICHAPREDIIQKNKTYHYIPMKKIIIPLLLAVIIILISCTGYYFFFLSTNPHITPDDTYTGNLTAEYTFPFKDGIVNLSVSVPASVYYGAQNTESKYLPYTKAGDLSFYADLTNDPLQEEMYTQILDQTETVRQSWDLTDDEYIELLATFVQSINYSSESDFRYPIETVIGEFGDCDDKSTLLAGLLTRSGYNAVLLIFEEESHATVGIRTNDSTAYPNAEGYSVIETTDYSYVTDRSFTFEDGASLNSTPVIVSVGTGDTTYTSGYQVEAILAYKDTADAKIDQLASETDTKTGNLESMGDTLTGYETRLTSLESLMNTAVSSYNSYIDLANAITKEQKKLNSDLNANKISYTEYSLEWEALEAEYAGYMELANEALDEYNAYYDEYQTLYAEYTSYYSTYSSAYTDYSGTIELQNGYVDIYNLIITEPYNRAYLYRTVLEATGL
ncbi:hypothetical protein Mlab_0180 [Methanocorpusculum labreanum Z]|uniref:Transglutaminase-like domain-containing protein n=2 Tax=Methanocorpusculum labreanum TaxID=83984 RepID=A2SPV0_METLZ|nr:hypothetical protein Mlab_0180 [Methanocorpusculum labreanum Z]